MCVVRFLCVEKRTLKGQLIGDFREEYALAVFGYLFLFLPVIVACFSIFSSRMVALCAVVGVFVYFFATVWRTCLFFKKSGKDVSHAPKLFCETPSHVFVSAVFAVVRIVNALRKSFCSVFAALFRAVSTLASAFAHFVKIHKRAILSVFAALFCIVAAVMAFFVLAVYVLAWIYVIVCVCAAVGCVLKLF